MCMDFNYMKDFPDLCHPTLGEAHYMDEKSSFYSSKWDLLLLSYGYLERCCLLPSTGRDLSLKLCILDRIFCQLTQFQWDADGFRDKKKIEWMTNINRRFLVDPDQRVRAATLRICREMILSPIVLVCFETLSIIDMTSMAFERASTWERVCAFRVFQRWISVIRSQVSRETSYLPSLISPPPTNLTFEDQRPPDVAYALRPALTIIPRHIIASLVCVASTSSDVLRLPAVYELCGALMLDPATCAACGVHTVLLKILTCSDSPQFPSVALLKLSQEQHEYQSSNKHLQHQQRLRGASVNSNSKLKKHFSYFSLDSDLNCSRLAPQVAAVLSFAMGDGDARLAVSTVDNASWSQLIRGICAALTDPASSVDFADPPRGGAWPRDVLSVNKWTLIAATAFGASRGLALLMRHWAGFAALSASPHGLGSIIQAISLPVVAPSCSAILFLIEDLLLFIRANIHGSALLVITGAPIPSVSTEASTDARREKHSFSSGIHYRNGADDSLSSLAKGSNEKRSQDSEMYENVDGPPIGRESNFSSECVSEYNASCTCACHVPDHPLMHARLHARRLHSSAVLAAQKTKMENEAKLRESFFQRMEWAKKFKVGLPPSLSDFGYGNGTYRASLMEDLKSKQNQALNYSDHMIKSKNTLNVAPKDSYLVPSNSEAISSDTSHLFSNSDKNFFQGMTGNLSSNQTSSFKPQNTISSKHYDPFLLERCCTCHGAIPSASQEVKNRSYATPGLAYAVCVLRTLLAFKVHIRLCHRYCSVWQSEEFGYLYAQGIEQIVGEPGSLIPDFDEDIREFDEFRENRYKDEKKRDSANVSQFETNLNINIPRDRSSSQSAAINISNEAPAHNALKRNGVVPNFILQHFQQEQKSRQNDTHNHHRKRDERPLESMEFEYSTLRAARRVHSRCVSRAAGIVNMLVSAARALLSPEEAVTVYKECSGFSFSLKFLRNSAGLSQMFLAKDKFAGFPQIDLQYEFSAHMEAFELALGVVITHAKSKNKDNHLLNQQYPTGLNLSNESPLPHQLLFKRSSLVDKDETPFNILQPDQTDPLEVKEAKRFLQGFDMKSGVMNRNFGSPICWSIIPPPRLFNGVREQWTESDLISLKLFNKLPIYNPNCLISSFNLTENQNNSVNPVNSSNAFHSFKHSNVGGGQDKIDLNSTGASSNTHPTSLSAPERQLSNNNGSRSNSFVQSPFIPRIAPSAPYTSFLETGGYTPGVDALVHDSACSTWLSAPRNFPSSSLMNIFAYVAGESSRCQIHLSFRALLQTGSFNGTDRTPSQSTSKIIPAKSCPRCSADEISTGKAFLNVLNSAIFLNQDLFSDSSTANVIENAFILSNMFATDSCSNWNWPTLLSTICTPPIIIKQMVIRPWNNPLDSSLSGMGAFNGFLLGYSLLDFCALQPWDGSNRMVTSIEFISSSLTLTDTECWTGNEVDFPSELVEKYNKNRTKIEFLDVDRDFKTGSPYLSKSFSHDSYVATTPEGLYFKQITCPQFDQPFKVPFSLEKGNLVKAGRLLFSRFFATLLIPLPPNLSTPNPEPHLKSNVPTLCQLPWMANNLLIPATIAACWRYMIGTDNGRSLFPNQSFFHGNRENDFMDSFSEDNIDSENDSDNLNENIPLSIEFGTIDNPHNKTSIRGFKGPCSDSNSVNRSKRLSKEEITMKNSHLSSASNFTGAESPNLNASRDFTKKPIDISTEDANNSFRLTPPKNPDTLPHVDPLRNFVTILRILTVHLFDLPPCCCPVRKNAFAAQPSIAPPHLFTPRIGSYSASTPQLCEISRLIHLMTSGFYIAFEIPHAILRPLNSTPVGIALLESHGLFEVLFCMIPIKHLDLLTGQIVLALGCFIEPYSKMIVELIAAKGSAYLRTIVMKTLVIQLANSVEDKDHNNMPIVPAKCIHGNNKDLMKNTTVDRQISADKNNRNTNEIKHSSSFRSTINTLNKIKIDCNPSANNFNGSHMSLNLTSSTSNQLMQAREEKNSLAIPSSPYAVLDSNYSPSISKSFKQEELDTYKNGLFDGPEIDSDSLDDDCAVLSPPQLNVVPSPFDHQVVSREQTNDAVSSRIFNWNKHSIDESGINERSTPNPAYPKQFSNFIHPSNKTAMEFNHNSTNLNETNRQSEQPSFLRASPTCIPCMILRTEYHYRLNPVYYPRPDPLLTQNGVSYPSYFPKLSCTCDQTLPVPPLSSAATKAGGSNAWDWFPKVAARMLASCSFAPRPLPLAFREGGLNLVPPEPPRYCMTTSKLHPGGIAMSPLDRVSASDSNPYVSERAVAFNKIFSIKSSGAEVWSSSDSSTVNPTEWSPGDQLLDCLNQSLPESEDDNEYHINYGVNASNIPLDSDSENKKTDRRSNNFSKAMGCKIPYIHIPRARRQRPPSCTPPPFDSTSIRPIISSSLPVFSSPPASRLHVDYPGGIKASSIFADTAALFNAIVLRDTLVHVADCLLRMAGFDAFSKFLYVYSKLELKMANHIIDIAHHKVPRIYDTFDINTILNPDEIHDIYVSFPVNSPLLNNAPPTPPPDCLNLQDSIRAFFFASWPRGFKKGFLTLELGARFLYSHPGGYNWIQNEITRWIHSEAAIYLIKLDGMVKNNCVTRTKPEPPKRSVHVVTIPMPSLILEFLSQPPPAPIDPCPITSMDLPPPPVSPHAYMMTTETLIRPRTVLQSILARPVDVPNIKTKEMPNDDPARFADTIVNSYGPPSDHPIPPNWSGDTFNVFSSLPWRLRMRIAFLDSPDSILRPDIYTPLHLEHCDTASLAFFLRGMIPPSTECWFSPCATLHLPLPVSGSGIRISVALYCGSHPIGDQNSVVSPHLAYKKIDAFKLTQPEWHSIDIPVNYLIQSISPSQNKNDDGNPTYPERPNSIMHGPVHCCFAPHPTEPVLLFMRVRTVFVPSRIISKPACIPPHLFASLACTKVGIKCIEKSNWLPRCFDVLRSATLRLPGMRMRKLPSNDPVQTKLFEVARRDARCFNEPAASWASTPIPDSSLQILSWFDVRTHLSAVMNFGSMTSYACDLLVNTGIIDMVMLVAQTCQNLAVRGFALEVMFSLFRTPQLNRRLYLNNWSPQTRVPILALPINIRSSESMIATRLKEEEAKWRKKSIHLIGLPPKKFNYTYLSIKEVKDESFVPAYSSKELTSNCSISTDRQSEISSPSAHPVDDLFKVSSSDSEAYLDVMEQFGCPGCSSCYEKSDNDSGNEIYSPESARDKEFDFELDRISPALHSPLDPSPINHCMPAIPPFSSHFNHNSSSSKNLSSTAANLNVPGLPFEPFSISSQDLPSFAFWVKNVGPTEISPSSVKKSGLFIEGSKKISRQQLTTDKLMSDSMKAHENARSSSSNLLKNMFSQRINNEDTLTNGFGRQQDDDAFDESNTHIRSVLKFKNRCPKSTWTIWSGADGLRSCKRRCINNMRKDRDALRQSTMNNSSYDSILTGSTKKKSRIIKYKKKEIYLINALDKIQRSNIYAVPAFESATSLRSSALCQNFDSSPSNPNNNTKNTKNINKNANSTVEDQKNLCSDSAHSSNSQNSTHPNLRLFPSSAVASSLPVRNSSVRPAPYKPPQWIAIRRSVEFARVFRHCVSKCCDLVLPSDDLRADEIPFEDLTVEDWKSEEKGLPLSSAAISKLVKNCKNFGDMRLVILATLKTVKEREKLLQGNFTVNPASSDKETFTKSFDGRHSIKLKSKRAMKQQQLPLTAASSSKTKENDFVGSVIKKKTLHIGDSCNKNNDCQVNMDIDKKSNTTACAELIYAIQSEPQDSRSPNSFKPKDHKENVNESMENPYKVSHHQPLNFYQEDFIPPHFSENVSKSSIAPVPFFPSVSLPKSFSPVTNDYDPGSTSFESADNTFEKSFECAFASRKKEKAALLNHRSNLARYEQQRYAAMARIMIQSRTGPSSLNEEGVDASDRSDEPLGSTMENSLSNLFSNPIISTEEGYNVFDSCANDGLIHVKPVNLITNQPLFANNSIKPTELSNANAQTSFNKLQADKDKLDLITNYFPNDLSHSTNNLANMADKTLLTSPKTFFHSISSSSSSQLGSESSCKLNVSPRINRGESFSLDAHTTTSNYEERLSTNSNLTLFPKTDLHDKVVSTSSNPVTLLIKQSQTNSQCNKSVSLATVLHSDSYTGWDYKDYPLMKPRLWGHSQAAPSLECSPLNGDESDNMFLDTNTSNHQPMHVLSTSMSFNSTISNCGRPLDEVFSPHNLFLIMSPPRDPSIFSNCNEEDEIDKINEKEMNQSIASIPLKSHSFARSPNSSRVNHNAYMTPITKIGDNNLNQEKNNVSPEIHEKLNNAANENRSNISSTGFMDNFFIGVKSSYESRMLRYRHPKFDEQLSSHLAGKPVTVLEESASSSSSSLGNSLNSSSSAPAVSSSYVDAELNGAAKEFSESLPSSSLSEEASPLIEISQQNILCSQVLSTPKKEVGYAADLYTSLQRMPTSFTKKEPLVKNISDKDQIDDDACKVANMVRSVTIGVGQYSPTLEDLKDDINNRNCLKKTCGFSSKNTTPHNAQKSSSVFRRSFSQPALSKNSDLHPWIFNLMTLSGIQQTQEILLLTATAAALPAKKSRRLAAATTHAPACPIIKDYSAHHEVKQSSKLNQEKNNENLKSSTNRNLPPVQSFSNTAVNVKKLTSKQTLSSSPPISYEMKKSDQTSGKMDDMAILESLHQTLCASTSTLLSINTMEHSPGATFLTEKDKTLSSNSTASSIINHGKLGIMSHDDKDPDQKRMFNTLLRKAQSILSNGQQNEKNESKDRTIAPEWYEASLFEFNHVHAAILSRIIMLSNPFLAHKAQSSLHKMKQSQQYRNAFTSLELWRRIALLLMGSQVPPQNRSMIRKLFDDVLTPAALELTDILRKFCGPQFPLMPIDYNRLAQKPLVKISAQHSPDHK